MTLSLNNKKNRRNRRLDNQATVYCHFLDDVFEKKRKKKEDGESTFILSNLDNNDLLIMYIYIFMKSEIVFDLKEEKEIILIFIYFFVIYLISERKEKQQPLSYCLVSFQ